MDLLSFITVYHINYLGEALFHALGELSTPQVYIRLNIERRHDMLLNKSCVMI